MQGILEKDEEGDRVVMVLREHPKTMTDKELRKYERNMVPADLYDEDPPPEKKT
tara:strand:- start:61 stop:222 length:162 start_codon:yes stop_codon:yes gene_type:complete